MAESRDKETAWTWQAFEAADYAREADDLVHFSFKTINSNAAQGGVRLTHGAGLPLPYVSARTLIAQGYEIPLDYVANRGKTAKILKQINALLSETAKPEDADEECAIHAAMDAVRANGREIGTDHVSIRLRQLLLPKGDGYVALTPLGSGGLCRLINAHVEAHEQARRDETETRPRPRSPETSDPPARRRALSIGLMGFGGANPQNVGALVREMQRPLVFFPPTEDRQIRRALALYYRGIPLQVPRPAMLEYRRWRRTLKAGHDGPLPTDLKTRQAEQALILAILAPILQAAVSARDLLQRHRDILPANGDPLLSEQVAPEIRGLIDPAQRDKHWSRDLSKRIALRIADFDFQDDEGGFSFDQKSVVEIAGWIEEALR